MAKLIKLDDIQKSTKKFYEICSDISILQRELDEMLVAIEKNSSDFQKGNISKDLFVYNENRMKKESAKIIKRINDLIDEGTSFMNKIGKEVENQRIKEKVKKRRNRIEEIKKGMKPKIKKTKRKKTKSKKVRKVKSEKKVEKTETAETTTEVSPPEQKVEGS